MTVNRIRYLHFMSGVLERQQADPLCSRCKAFSNTVARTREAIAACLADETAGMPPSIMALLTDARGRLLVICVQEDAVGQKKAGNCLMPEGVCFVKNSKKIGEAL